jgi:ABC-type amino acid transport substrate-binding protein
MRTAVASRQLLLAALLACPALAAQPLRALLPDTEPYAYRNEHGEVVGVYVDLTRQLAARAGLTVQIGVAPVPRVVHEINGGAADFTLLLPYHFNRDVLDLGAALSMEVWLLPRASLPLARAADVNGRSVIGFKGTPAQLSLPAGVTVQWQDASSARVMVSMVKAGRADVALGVRETLMSGLRAAGLRGTAAEGFGTPVPVGQVPVTLWGRPGLPQASA